MNKQTYNKSQWNKTKICFSSTVTNVFFKFLLHKIYNDFVDFDFMKTSYEVDALIQILDADKRRRCMLKFIF